MNMAEKQRGRYKINLNKMLLNIFSKILTLSPLRFRKYFLVKFRNKEGITGIVLRYILLKSIVKKCGDNVTIMTNVFLLSPENLMIGNNVSVHPFSYIDATGGITIGDDVSIAHSCTILSTSHNYSRSDIPIKNQGVSTKETIIKKNNWIGCKVTILFGVKVGTGNVIAANSLVNKDVKNNVIVGGVPAKLLGKRVD